MADSEEVSVSNDSEPLLSVRHLRKSYGDHEVLKDVSFDVKRGQVLVLLGPSGSGKSTLIRCLNGLETIQGGEIWFKGQKIANNSEKTWRKLRAEIGMVFQSYDLFPNLTVEEEEVTIGKYGMLRRTFLKEHKNSLYQSLFLTGKLNSHLEQIEKAAQERMDSQMEKLLEKNPAPDKEADPMAWTAHMNALMATAEESILTELVYS